MNRTTVCAVVVTPGKSDMPNELQKRNLSGLLRRQFTVDIERIDGYTVLSREFSNLREAMEEAEWLQRQHITAWVR